MGKKLDFKEIKLSSKIRDIHKIEKKSISIRVFGYENKEKHQIYKPKICCKETHVDLLLLGKEGKRQIIFKNNLPICDIFGNPYICWDNFLSIYSTDKFWIPWKSQEKMMSIDVSHIYGGYVEKEKNQSQVWTNLEANS